MYKILHGNLTIFFFSKRECDDCVEYVLHCISSLIVLFLFCFTEVTVSDEQLAVQCSSPPLEMSCSAPLEDFSQSGMSAATEEGLLGRVLFEESSSFDASPGGEGGYGKAPGFEREDQV